MFPSETGTPLDVSNVMARVLKPAARRAGVPWAGFHSLRHTYATRLFERGLNAKQVQAWLGHHKASFTLDTYVHLLSDELPESPFGEEPEDEPHEPGATAPRRPLALRRGRRVGRSPLHCLRGVPRLGCFALPDLLRPAEIEADRVPHAHEIAQAGAVGPIPDPARLVLAIAVSNAGAHGGLLQDVAVDGFEYVGDDPPFSIGASAGGAYDDLGTSRPALMPVALEAGDVERFFLAVSLFESEEGERDAATLARRLRGLRAIRVRLRWSFVATRGLPRRRTTVRRERWVEIDCSAYRAGILGR